MPGAQRLREPRCHALTRPATRRRPDKSQPETDEQHALTASSVVAAVPDPDIDAPSTAFFAGPSPTGGPKCCARALGSSFTRHDFGVDRERQVGTPPELTLPSESWRRGLLGIWSRPLRSGKPPVGRRRHSEARSGSPWRACKIGAGPSNADCVLFIEAHGLCVGGKGVLRWSREWALRR